MSDRVKMPATLTRSGEGVTFAGTGQPLKTTQSIPKPLGPSPLSQSPLSPGPAMVPVVATPIVQVGPPVVAEVRVVTPGAPGQEWGVSFNPLNILILVIIFVVVWVILYTTKMHLVTDLVNGDRKINSGKLLMWTVIIGIIICVLWAIGAAAWKYQPGTVVIR